MTTLQFLGGGRMADAMLGGLLADGVVAVGDVVVCERSAARRDELSERYEGLRVVAAPVACDDAVVATKPGDVADALAATAAAGVRHVLSIAAGVTIAVLQRCVQDHDGAAPVAVLRAMPNTPALVGVGAAAVAAGDDTSQEDLDWAASLLGAVGSVVVVDEAALDAVTGLSGSGPAYVYLVAEAMIDAGVHMGLPRAQADALVRQTLLGAATMLAGGESPEALRAQVTSPGGTTAAGLRVLEERAVRAAMIDAVAAATQRSVELGS